MAPVVLHSGPSQGTITRGLNTFMVAATAVTPTSRTSAYLRVSAMTLAAYDWFITLRPEIRLYQRHKAWSRGVVFFVLIRYVSLAAIITSNIGFFGKGFSVQACHNYYLVAPLLKMFATLISQVIISIRTYAISRQAKWVLWVLSVLFIVSCVPEVLGNAWQRKSVQNATHNCTSGNLRGHKVAWLHYLAAVVFDAVAMGIATFYLYSPTQAGITGLAKVMLEEGLLYFVFLTIANVVNLIMFFTADIAAQSSAAVYGQAVTMMLSQRIILNLQKWTTEPSPAPSRSRSRSAPDYAMHVLATGGSGARSHSTSAPKTHDGWLEPGNGKPTEPGWSNPKRGPHARRGSSTLFEIGSEGGAGVRVVVEHEVRYENDALSESEKSVSDAKK